MRKKKRFSMHRKCMCCLALFGFSVGFSPKSICFSPSISGSDELNVVFQGYKIVSTLKDRISPIHGTKY